MGPEERQLRFEMIGVVSQFLLFRLFLSLSPSRLKGKMRRPSMKSLKAGLWDFITRIFDHRECAANSDAVKSLVGS